MSADGWIETTPENVLGFFRRREDYPIVSDELIADTVGLDSDKAKAAIAELVANGKLLRLDGGYRIAS